MNSVISDGQTMRGSTDGSAEACKPKAAPVFACSQCGGCCTNVNVLVPNEWVHELQAKPWASERLTAVSARFTDYDGAQQILPQLPSGHCAFLADDRCLIEQHEGHAAKPLDCRRFPFGRAVHQGGRTFAADTSAACVTVAKGLLANVTAWQSGEGVSELAAVEPPLLPEKIKVTHGPWGKSLSPEDYLQWVATVREGWLADTAATTPQRLRWLNEGLRRGTFPSLESLPDTPFRNESWLRRLWLRKPYGVWSAWGLLLDDEYADPRLLGQRPVAITHIEAIECPPTLEAPLRAFLFTLWQRKMPLTYGHSLQSQLMIAVIAHALVRWYARLFAQLAEETTVSEDALILAIRVVERYYTGHQPRFPERVRRLPWLGAWLHWSLQ